MWADAADESKESPEEAAAREQRMRREMAAAAVRFRDEVDAMPKSFVRTAKGTTFDSIDVGALEELIAVPRAWREG